MQTPRRRKFYDWNFVKEKDEIVDTLGEKVKKGETILFSEVLEQIPSDEVLSELFPDPYQGKSSITHFGLEVLKLRLQGFKQVQIAEMLRTTKSRVSYWSQTTINGLYRTRPDNVEIDIPALRRLLNLEWTTEGRYTRLSELLRDMPSDEELKQLDKERGNLDSQTTRHRVTQKDLYILRQRLDGRSYDSICAELGWSRVQVRRNMQATRKRLIRDLRIELDVPRLFKPYKPGQLQLQPSICASTYCEMIRIPGEHIIAYRKAHGESVAQFASGCGVSVSSIRKIEKGISEPSILLIWKIAKYMKVKMNDLYRKIP